MKKNAIACLLLLTSGTTLLLSACNNSQPVNNVAVKSTYATVHLPLDVLPSCTVTKDTFNTWFSTGTATENGLVTPASSVAFGHLNNCDFYQWSERMFLWLTSKNSGVYGTAGTVMESSIFYTVAPDSTGGLQMIPHVPGGIIPAVSSLEKNGPNRLPVFTDKKGHMFEVQFHKQGEKVLVKNQAGKLIELGQVEKGVNTLAVLKDKAGNAIDQPTFISNFRHPEKLVHAFTTRSGTVFVDANGNEIDTEVGQATDNALIAQNGSMVYYITMVNDMYAYFLTAVKDGYMTGSQFPTTTSARDSILAYARQKGYNIPPDSNALAIEVKSSWIIADSLSNPGDFVTIEAEVPVYNTNSDTLWTVKDHKKVKLAMVGVHIVGSVAGHPEMVWATFEHNSNTPDAAYQYIDNKNQVQTVAADTGNWLFSSNASATDTFNQAYISTNKKDDNLRAVAPYHIGASNTQRVFPFGTALNTIPNQQDTSASASNSELISINQSVMSLIPGNDVRKKYLFIGATWTFGGAPPTGSVYPTDSTSGGAIGTSLLANSTMETYFQYTTTTCFFCHSRNNGLQPTDLSHIFKNIKPLTATLRAIRQMK